MEKGLLLPIFSLPSKYGIGDFGYEAYEFIDILSEFGIKYWQILPLNESSRKPYSPTSYYALDNDFVSIDKIIDMGLLNKDEVKYRKQSNRITYDSFKEPYYIKAFERFVPNEEYDNFIQKKQIQEFANFMEQKYKREKEYYLFLQYILDKQYVELKNYANSKGVYIIGDMPIYPYFSSAEVMYYSKYYQLNEEGKMDYVSGAPPDEANENGQKWFHPLYNFEELKKDNYQYLIDRFMEFLRRYDVIRIDHFKGFESYFKIPIDKSPKYGFYEIGPRYDFFNELFKYCDVSKFIAEDLGNLTPETAALRDYYNFTKTKVLIYTLNLNKPEDMYKPEKNMAIYTGNHDTNTLVGWYNSLSHDKIHNIVEFLKEQDCYESKSFHTGIIKYALKSDSKYIIIPVQDILGLDENSRINIPGKELNNNWSWNMVSFDKLRENLNIFKKICDII